jgi:hypothetical protein
MFALFNKLSGRSAVEAGTWTGRPAPRQPSGLTRVAAGLTRLPAGLRVQTHLKAGPNCAGCYGDDIGAGV